MKRKHLKGKDPNSLTLAVDNIQIESDVIMINGVMNPSIIIKISKYNLQDLLVQLLEDYGEEKLIEEIKKLD